MKRKRTPRILWILLAVLCVTALFFYFRDTRPPEVRLTPDAGLLRADSALQLTITDSGAGLKQVRVHLRSSEQRTLLADQVLPKGTASFTLEIDPAQQRPAEGPLTIEVEAGDRALYHFGKGNILTQSFTFTYDSRPPLVNVLSTKNYLSQGGAGLLAFTVDEAVRAAGVRIAGRTYPAYQLQNGLWACLFAFPHDADPDKDAPVLVATDLAGNEGFGKFYYGVRAIRYPQSRIRLSDGFLAGIRREFDQRFPGEPTDLALFLKVNGELRRENREKLPQIGLQTADAPLWQQAFLRAKGARTGSFGDRRMYMYQGKTVDRQTHLGIDIASITQAPVAAANNGTIVWADRLGIYGQCIIIDHGLGLMTLYGHLSRIEVSTGQTVNRGDVIGRTGVTGISGGDHLHFGVLVSGTPVDPVEWWDSAWVKNNILDKLSLTP